MVTLQKNLEKQIGQFVAEDYRTAAVFSKYKIDFCCNGNRTINEACEKLKENGARRALVLPVGGAFHSPLMSPAKEELEKAIKNTIFHKPSCPIYQNVTASAVMNENEIKTNLISQLTSPVRWTHTIQQMIEDGATEFIEVGPGKVLQGLVKKINRESEVSSATIF